MAPLRYTAKVDPFLSLDCARVEGGERKGRDQILPSGNIEEEGPAVLSEHHPDHVILVPRLPDGKI